MKGTHPLTENYSIVQPEVLERFDGKPLAQKNTRFLETMHRADAIIVAGQAKSHCVRASSEHLIREIKSQDPSLVKKMYVLEDCMSSVACRTVQGILRGLRTKPTRRSRSSEMDCAGPHGSLASWNGLSI